MLNTKIKISEKIKREIVRYAVSFFFAWLISSLISDFPFFIKKIKTLNIDTLLTEYYIYILDSFFSLFNINTYSNSNFFMIINTKGIQLTYGCLGLREFAIFIIFIFLQYGKLKIKIIYITVGTIILLLLNNIRLIILSYIQYISDKDIQQIHDIISPIIMYPTILFLWFLWLNKYSKK